MDSLGTALWITAAGMGLVFGAILLLWGLMAVLMRVAVDPVQPQSDGEHIAEENRKRMAAAIAVSMAFAEEVAGAPQEFPLPETPLITAWQAVMRSNILTKRRSIR